MNYYLIYGIVFVICLGIAVKYMPKYNGREVAFCIIAWTIIATSSASAFILAFPDRAVEERAVDAVTGAQPEAPEKPPLIDAPNPEVDSDKYFSTNAGDFHVRFQSEYESDNATTVQKEAILEEYSGKLVFWTGPVKDVSNDYVDKTWSVRIDVPTLEDTSFTAWFPEPSKELVEYLRSLNKGEEITVEGTTDMMVWSWGLDDAKIINE